MQSKQHETKKNKEIAQSQAKGKKRNKEPCKESRKKKRNTEKHRELQRKPVEANGQKRSKESQWKIRITMKENNAKQRKRAIKIKH